MAAPTAFLSFAGLSGESTLQQNGFAEQVGE
jgi:hypothetical protein